jgi:hypothetical protein
MTRLRLLACALVLAFTSTPRAHAIPKYDRPSVPIDITGVPFDCPEVVEPVVELVSYTYISGYPIVGFTVKIWGESVKFHGRPNIPCGFPDFIAPLPEYRWSLVSRPPGSTAQLGNAMSLAPLLPLDAVGSYLVRLTVCPDGCTIEPPGGHLAPVSVGAQFIDVEVQAIESAPLGPETTPAVVPSSSVGQTPQPSQCGALAGALGKQWWAVRQVETPDDYRLLEGFVRESRVSRKDNPLNHDSQDTNYHIEPDPKYSDLLFENSGPVTPPIEVEWERNSIPEKYRPTSGDRASIFGYWVNDCSHGRPEIHPPVGIAVHRPRPIRIPDTKTFTELGGQTAGTGVYVPGILTDMFFSNDGGDLVGCGTDTGLANAELVMTPGGSVAPGCVPAPSLQRLFEFDIYLPRNPRVTMQQAGFNVPPVPLYVQFDPVGPGPAPNIDIRTDPSGLLTYLHVTLDLRGYTGSTYSGRIATGWVLPSADNWGLARWRLRLVRLNVSDDGDGPPRGDGDWRLWVNTNNASNESFARQEWVQIINHDVHGLEDFGGRPWTTGRPGEPGAPMADRSLGPDLLRYPPATNTLIPGPRDIGILFHTTGYEADNLTDDDAGTVFRSRIVPGTPYALQNQCTPSEQAGGLLYSGCVRYTAVVEAVPGPALAPAALTQAAQSLADQYVLRCQGAFCKGGGYLDDLLAVPLEASPVDPRDATFPVRSGPLEITDFPPFGRGEREVTSLTEISITDFYRDVVRVQKTDPERLRRVLDDLHAFFAARIADRKTSADALLDVQILKVSLPPDLWTKHFADLPAPRPAPGSSRTQFTGAGDLLSGKGRVRLSSIVLHCAPLRTPNSFSVAWERSRFDLDLVLQTECTEDPSRTGRILTQHGKGIGRLNGVPGAVIEWTLVDMGEPAGNDTAAITIWSGHTTAIVLEASGRLAPGNLQARGTAAATGLPTGHASRDLSPLTLEHEAGPVEGGRPASAPRELELRAPQRGGRRLAVLQHRPVETLHQLRRRLVVDLPQAGHHARGARVHEAAGQAYEAFAPEVLPQTRLAPAQDHEVCRELEVVDVVQPQEAVRSPAVVVEQREHHTGQLRPARVEHGMRREVDDAVLRELGARGGRAIRGKTGGLEGLAAR